MMAIVDGFLLYNVPEILGSWSGRRFVGLSHEEQTHIRMTKLCYGAEANRKRSRKSRNVSRELYDELRGTTCETL